MKINIARHLAIAALVSSLASVAQANTLTLGYAGTLPSFRTATLDDATAGFTGSGNATVTDLNAGFAAQAPWTERGSIDPGDGQSGNFTNGIFAINVTGGSFGSKAASGTWTITNANFWTTYANGAISLHVGNGNGGPDHFAFLLEVGDLSGTWSYDGTGIKGGGLSNLKLYSSGTGTATQVPDGGATIALLGLAFMGIHSLRRKLGKA